MDVAPSVLALLGCTVPNDLDGKVLPALDVQAKTSAALPLASSDPETVYTEEEEAEVEDRLRNLGYL